MTITRNPFDVGGYSLAEMTQAINILPNTYTRIGELGLFRSEGVTQRSVVIEQSEGVLSLLPSQSWDGPTTFAKSDKRSMRSFAIPHIPHSDVINGSDIQGVPALGSSQAETLANVMMRKLERMRRAHAQTREYMEVNALFGIVKDGAGRTLYNYFSEFGLTRSEVDFTLGTAGTDVNGKVRSALRLVEDELRGETMQRVHALVSQEFFDKLIAHPTVKEAYKYYLAGQQPLREDVRRAFTYGGITFEEYRGVVSTPSGGSERLIPAGEGVAFPIGTFDTFTTYSAPANRLDTVNTMGLPLYAYQEMDPNGRFVNLHTEANILPINKRPKLSIRLFSTN